MSTVVCPFKEGGAFMKFLLNLLGIASLVVAQQFTHYSCFKSLFNHGYRFAISRDLSVHTRDITRQTMYSLHLTLLNDTAILFANQFMNNWFN